MDLIKSAFICYLDFKNVVKMTMMAMKTRIPITDPTTITEKKKHITLTANSPSLQLKKGYESAVKLLYFLEDKYSMVSCVLYVFRYFFCIIKTLS